MKTDTVETYLALLHSHDWNYEFSDDHSVWTRGREQEKRLMDLKYEFDRDGKLWDDYFEKRKKK